MEAISTFGHSAILLGIAGVAGLGGGVGWLAAQANSHDDMDEDTIKKMYQDKRLSSDMSYIGARIIEEARNRQAMMQPKPARII